MATLVEREVAGGAGIGDRLERVDFSMQSWQERGGGADPRYFGVWRSTFSEQTTPRKHLLSDEELLDLFEQLGASDQPRKVAFRYVLALLLVRKRLLRVMGTKLRTADAPALMMVLPRGATAESPAMQVIDPGLDPQSTSEVIEEVGQLLAAGDDVVVSQ